MRRLFALLYNAIALLLAAITLPLRLLGRRGHFHLTVELTGNPPWRGEGARRWRLGARRRPMRPASFEALAHAFEQAAGDRRVRGAIIKVEQFTGPGAKLDAVARIAARLRERGKPVVFYGRAVTMREYALMARGSRAQLAPGGQIDLRGYSADLFVAGGPLARAGVGAHFVRREDYKTAPELFTDREVSPAQRETVEGLLGELHARAVEAIAAGRNRGADEVRRWIDDGPFTASRALAAGLIDAIGDGEDLEASLAEAGEERARFVAVGRYKGPSLWPKLKPVRRRERIAVVKLHGLIKLGEAVAVPGMAPAAGSDAVASALRRARDDGRVRAIVLDIDSRGGSSLASELILRAVRRAAERKPVVVYVESYAASGGYMAAVGGTRIIAPPGAIVGSIGVFAGKFEIAKLLERLEVGTAVVRVGRNAALASPMLPWTEQDRAALERDVEETYQGFLRIVAEGRRRPVDEVRPLAGGRIYSGLRAHALGLVDAVGDFEAAIGEAAALGKLRRPPEIVVFQPPRHPLQALRQLGSAGEAWAAIRGIEAERLFALAPFWAGIDPKP